MTDDIDDTLREIVGRLDRAGVPYMLVGSVAALVHGRARSTHDFDLVIAPTSRTLREFVRSLPEARFYVSLEAADEAFATHGQFNVLDHETGWKVDLIIRKERAFSIEEFGRRQRADVSGAVVHVASAEDTILSKLEWSKAGGGSERQREDVQELIALAGPQLDRAYILRWVAQLGLEQEWEAVSSGERSR